MQRILFLFSPAGDLIRIIEDAERTGQYDKTVFVFGYDGTKIASFDRDTIGDYKFIILQDNETVNISDFTRPEDIERFNYNQWKSARDAAKTNMFCLLNTQQNIKPKKIHFSRFLKRL